MDNKKKHFYGTPLNKSLQDNDASNEEGSRRNKRKERLDREQTVRDDQGRQRFHGAFTGGFSAGYFNTVDSVAGFKPKQFVSRRGSNKQHGESFSHQPEDYMDEEDLGEFGIAPKRIRLTNQYQSDGLDLLSTGISGTGVRNILRSSSIQTIGDKILQQINSDFHNKRFSSIDNFKSPRFAQKNDFHGLGYKPLRGKEDTSKSTSNPLTAVLERGRRIKISGEAFGTGVLDDDEDYFVSTSDAYGYDDMSNYNFGKDKAKLTQLHHQQQPRRYAIDHVTGFVLANSNQGECSTDLGNLLKTYPHPNIPSTWKQPQRQCEEPIKIKLDFNFIPKPSTSCNALKSKFTHSSDILKTDDLQTKAGLVSFSDLSKVVQAKASKSNASLPKPIEVVPATISREKFEWRPCSLLCKHFNVPNPFPDNLFCGVKESQSKIKTESIQAEPKEAPKSLRSSLASMELKRSIYDVTIQTVIPNNVPSPNDARAESNDDDDDHDCDEELPQIVDILEITRKNDSADAEIKESEVSDSDDVEIQELPVERKEPELIILSSSDSDDSDSYGPPLPPTLKTLIDAHQLQSKSNNTLIKGKKRLNE